MAIRNLRAILAEKKLTMKEVARMAGCQVSTIEMIIIGVFVPGIDMRIKICQALGEPLNNEIFESGLKDHMAPIR